MLSAKPASRLNLKRPRDNRYLMNSHQGHLKGRLATRWAAGKHRGRGLVAASFKAAKLVLGVVLILSLLGGVSAGLILGYQSTVNSQYFMVRKVVLTGINRVSREEILAKTGLDKATNILAVKLESMGESVRSLPWVEEVTITRKLPDTIMVEVKERRPRTLINLGGLYYLDENGKPFKKLGPQEKPEFPIITGFIWDDFAKREEMTRRDLKEVFALLEVLADRNDSFRLENISEINSDPARGLTIFTRDNNVQVKVGLGEYRAKMRRLGRVLANLKIRGQAEGLVYFNLESSPRVIVRRVANT